MGIVKSFNRHLETFFASTQNDLVFLSQSQPLNYYLSRHSQNSPTLEKARQAVEEEFLVLGKK